MPSTQTLADMRAVVENWFSLREAGEVALRTVLENHTPDGLSPEHCCEVVVRMGLARFRDTTPPLPAENRAGES